MLEEPEQLTGDDSVEASFGFARFAVGESAGDVGTVSGHRSSAALSSSAPVLRGCVIVRDSVADITAARRARVASIGYANRPGKRRALTEAGADAIVGTMAELLVQART